MKSKKGPIKTFQNLQNKNGKRGESTVGQRMRIVDRLATIKEAGFRQNSCK